MIDLAERLAGAAGRTVNVVCVVGALAAALLAGSAVRAVSLARASVSPEDRRKWLGSLATWWVLFALLVVVAGLGMGAAVVAFTCISLLGLREYRALARARIAPVRPWWRLVYLAVPVHYLFIYLGWLDLVWSFIPVWVFCALLVRLVLVGQTSGFVETVGVTFLGLMLIGYLLSHAVLLFTLPPEVNPAGGGFGLLLFLLILTEGNDIAQAQWGRRLGRRKITPAVSPNKTWEGFLLGAATTVLLAVALAPLITPFAAAPPRLGSWPGPLAYLPAMAVGLLIAVGGFLGDVTMSAIKREVGVKDAGTLLPGQGGVLDRVDSLTFTGPLVFHFTYLLYERGTP